LKAFAEKSMPMLAHPLARIEGIDAKIQKS